MALVHDLHPPERRIQHVVRPPHAVLHHVQRIVLLPHLISNRNRDILEARDLALEVAHEAIVLAVERVLGMLVGA
eukprot:CAMPEP_0173419008 /NCGR_PEP_ID=MMETSP1357-20121228/991_1 /TAXON_ID=77926 /ORGANISM="Hemiselmis rufescens, Strain PCC563" /LENGTH=74 /DNA_ID=CAMNT_0014381571 /DNA_START=151 /DNA_END=375 /DNA_ORIENTATION=+